MRFLAIDAACATCSIAILADDQVVATRLAESSRGAASSLPSMVADALAALPGKVDAVAVSVGPGSFTGLRAALSLAHGLALGFAVPLIGVSVAEALADMAGDLAGRALWVALDNRRGRLFLDRGGLLTAVTLTTLPMPDGPVAVAGDAAVPVAARLAACGWDVLLTPARQPHAVGVGRAALRRVRGELPPLPAIPLYVDPPEARLPAGGLRPTPA